MIGGTSHWLFGGQTRSCHKLEKKHHGVYQRLAIKAAKNAIDDQEFYNFSLEKTVEAKKLILEGLVNLNLEYAPSNTNFIFFKSGINIVKLQKQMLEKGIMVGRPFPPFYDWCRISTGTLREVIMFNDALKKIICLNLFLQAAIPDL